MRCEIKLVPRSPAPPTAAARLSAALGLRVAAPPSLPLCRSRHIQFRSLTSKSKQLWVMALPPISVHRFTPHKFSHFNLTHFSANPTSPSSVKLLTHVKSKLVSVSVLQVTANEYNPSSVTLVQNAMCSSCAEVGGLVSKGHKWKSYTPLAHLQTPQVLPQHFQQLIGDQVTVVQVQDAQVRAVNRQRQQVFVLHELALLRAEQLQIRGKVLQSVQRSPGD